MTSLSNSVNFLYTLFLTEKYSFKICFRAVSSFNVILALRLETSLEKNCTIRIPAGVALVEILMEFYIRFL